MTKLLSDFLDIHGPKLRVVIDQLEQTAGSPNADIRLGVEILQKTKQKLHELGLDPNNTTAEELYVVLQQKLAVDEAAIRGALNLPDDAGSSEIISTVQVFMQKTTKSSKVFALKASVAKRLLKANPPRKVMKQLGYRSLDSMLKHEAVPDIYAAASFIEAPIWHKQQLDAYSQLQPSDFEPRGITVTHPSSERWQKLADEHVIRSRHNVLFFKELGAAVLLPFPRSVAVPGLTLVVLLMALHACNELRAASSYIKLQQVRPDFGKVIQHIATHEPFTRAKVGGQDISWQLLHRFFAAHKSAYPAHVFEPHIQPEDLEWHHAEQAVAELEPTLAFWVGTEYCGLSADGKTVSLNLFDAVLNYCNQLPFTSRVTQYLKNGIWHELTSRYIQQERVEQAVTEQLGDELLGNALIAE